MKRVQVRCKWTVPLILFLSHCGFDDLKSELLLKIPLDQEVLNYPQQNGVYHEIPGKVGIEDDKLIISEPSARSIKIFHKSKLETVIRSKKFYSDPNNEDQTALPPDVQEVFLGELHIPGMISTTSDDSFYVLNYTPKESNKKSQENTGKYDILHIDYEGKLKGALSRKASAPKNENSEKEENSFTNLRWLDVDEEDRLWVLYEYEHEIFLEAHENHEMIHRFSEIECKEALFHKTPQPGDEERSCEVFYPFSDGDSILLVGRVEEVEKGEEDLDDAEYKFKERVFKALDIESKEITNIFTHQSGPEESAYLPYDDKSFIVWVTKDYHHFRLEIYNLAGDIQKNFQIELEGSAHSWRSTYTTLRGGIYSIRVSDHALFVYRWQ